MVWVEGCDELMGEGLEAEAAACYSNLCVVLGADAVFHSGQAAGDAGDDVIFGVAEGDGLQQALEADAGLFLHGAGVGLVLLAHADGVDDDEVVLGLGVGGDGLEVVGRDHAHAAAFHLLEEAARFDGAHEEDDFDRLDVGAGGDHVDGDGDARVVAVAEGGDEVLRGSSPVVR